jgi:4-amino-4-deoxy-L-arabinose transferase-like glycosyltransferase
MTSIQRAGLLLPLVFTLLVAASARQAYIHLRPVDFRGGVGCYADSYVYLDAARNLARNRQYSLTQKGKALEPTCFKAPMYPAFLAVQMALGVTDHTTFRLVQGFADSVSAVFVFMASWFIFRLRSAALAAGLLMALSPFNIHYSRALLSDWLGSTLMAAAFMCLAAGLARRRHLGLIASAAIMGLAALTRPAVMLFPLVVAPFILFAFRGRRWKSRLGSVAVFLLVFASVMGVWTLRNYRVSGHFIPVTVSGLPEGLLWGTYETPQNWDWLDLPAEFIPDPKERRRIAEMYRLQRRLIRDGTIEQFVANGEKMEELAWERIQRDRRQYLMLCLSRVPMLWWNHSKRLYSDLDPSGLWVIPFLIGWLLSPLFLRGRTVTFLPIWLFPVYVTLMHLPLHVEPRYSLVAFPALCIAGGPVYGRLFSLLGRRLISHRSHDHQAGR